MMPPFRHYLSIAISLFFFFFSLLRAFFMITPRGHYFHYADCFRRPPLSLMIHAIIDYCDTPFFAD